MSTQIISQTSPSYQVYSLVGVNKYWIPANVVPGLVARAEIRVTPAQFDVALAWADRTAEDPNTPRRSLDVFPESHEASLRQACYKLFEKGILVREGCGYVMFEAARQHVNYHRDREA